VFGLRSKDKNITEGYSMLNCASLLRHKHVCCIVLTERNISFVLVGGLLVTLTYELFVMYYANKLNGSSF
jgi:hypothetical protein